MVSQRNADPDRVTHTWQGGNNDHSNLLYSSIQGSARLANHHYVHALAVQQGHVARNVPFLIAIIHFKTLQAESSPLHASRVLPAHCSRWPLRCSAAPPPH
eukprot:3097145-Pyramimonas_sp.AAC.1